MHFASADLELDNFFLRGDDGSVEGLVAVLFRLSDVVLDALVHRSIERVEETEGEVATGNVGDDDAEGGEVVDFAHILIMFGKFFVEGVDGFDATGDFGVDFFFFEKIGNFFFNFFERFGGLFIVFFDEVFEIFEALRVNVGESDVGEFDAETTHIKTVGEGSEDFQSFQSDFLLLVGRESGESASVVETVGELDDEDADVVAGGNH